MEREQIIKALECISRTGDVLCEGCDYRKHGGFACHRIGAENAIALINELIEEADRHKKRADRHFENLKSVLDERSDIEADTVRKMQERLKQCFKVTEDGNAMYVENSVVFAIDQIAKEMLEEIENE